MNANVKKEQPNESLKNYTDDELKEELKRRTQDSESIQEECLNEEC